MSRRERGRRGGARPTDPRKQPARRTAAEPAAPALPLPLAHPAFLVLALVATACLLYSVTFRIDDPDIWQHLLVGKAIWSLHRIPLEHQWTWPSFGQPEVLPSWGFRALLWPFWALGGEAGLLAWRWLTTLATFALLWATARRMGARGVSALVVLVVAGLVWRARSEVRPETIVAPLLALQLFVLETRRRATGRDFSWLLVVIACVWANVHISYYLGLAIVACYALDERLRRRLAPAAAPSPRRVPLEWIGLACVLVSFLNPFGGRALAQPFEYFLVWRYEPIFRTIVELMPLDLSRHWRSGLPLLLFGWPLLILWRTRRRGRAGFDLAEALVCIGFTLLARSGQRFAGLYAIAAAPFVARDLGEWVAARRWPDWTRQGSRRALLAALACVLVGIAEWTRPGYPPGYGIEMKNVPVQATEFMRSENIRGRGFNPYYLGGWMLWRFWPDRGRLPFMDIHQTGTREDRRLLVAAYQKGEPWHELDRKHRFDYVLLEAYPEALIGDRLLDTVDEDTTFALVFRDDAAALFVRRDGPLAEVARRLGYRFVPASDAHLPARLQPWLRDAEFRLGMDAEIERMLRSSPRNARAHSMLGTLAWVAGRPDEARAHLRAALATDPRHEGAHQRLAVMALIEGHPDEALRELDAERKLGAPSTDLPMLYARTWRALGSASEAKRWLERELKERPLNAAARESLRVIEAEIGRR